MLPPTTDSLRQHLEHSNYQAFDWSHALEAMQDLGSPEDHGWVLDGELLVLLPITKAPAPVSLLKLMTCKISAYQQNCSCSNTGLACTEVCFRMADDEACSNRHGLTCISDSEENNEESSFERNCKIANI